MGFKVVYLTGAPAAGKSSLVSAIGDVIHPLLVFQYGEELLAHARARSDDAVTKERLRAASDATISPDDVRAVDKKLLQMVARRRRDSNIIIDTHAVSKEIYGFRVTPFSLSQVAQLSPDWIVCLFTDPATTLLRISKDADGRSLVNEFEANMHTLLQGQVAITYGMQLGTPIYFLDSTRTPSELVDWFIAKLGMRRR